METMSETSVAGTRNGGRFALPSGLRIQEYALVAVIIVLLVVGSILKPDGFPTSGNFRAIFTQSSVVGVIAIGMTLVIATSGIDLSVGSIVAAAGIAGGLLIGNGSVAFVFGALGFALLLGTINAVAIAYGRVVPFVATLAMLAMARGLALKMSDKKPISLLSSEGVRWFGTGDILGVPVSIVIFLALTIVGWLLLNRTRTDATSSPSEAIGKPPASPASRYAGRCSPSTASRGCSPGWRPFSSAAGSAAPRRCPASFSSSTRSARWSSVGPASPVGGPRSSARSWV